MGIVSTSSTSCATGVVIGRQRSAGVAPRQRSLSTCSFRVPAGARGGSEAHCPLAGEAARLDRLPFAVGVGRRPGARTRPGRALPRRATTWVITHSLRLPAPCGATDGFL